MRDVSEKQGDEAVSSEAGFLNLPANLRIMRQFGAKARELVAKIDGLKGRQNRAERKQVEDELRAAQAVSRRAFLKVFGLGSAVATVGILTGVGISASGEKFPDDEEGSSVPSRGNDRSVNVERERLLGEQETRDLYNQGFSKVMDGIPDEPSENNDGLTNELSSLKHFRNKYCNWARLGADGYYALEDGHTGTAWMSVVMPGSPDYENLPGIVSVDPERTDVNMLKIKPVPITKTWAGIVLTHELAHLRDIVTGREKKNPSMQEFLKGEVLAYFSEIVLADRLTNGRYSQEMKKIIDEMGIRDTDSAVAFFKSPSSESISRRLDSLFDESEPKGEDERALRDGFYTVSICFAIIGREKLPEDQKIQKFKDFIGKLMGK